MRWRPRAGASRPRRQARNNEEEPRGLLRGSSPSGGSRSAVYRTQECVARVKKTQRDAVDIGNSTLTIGRYFDSKRTYGLSVMEQNVRDTENPRSSERRQKARRRALKSALIVFKDGYCDIKCHVLDFSDTGALLQPADVIQCPNRFVLKPSSGPARTCEVVWRDATTVGVRYCD